MSISKMIAAHPDVGDSLNEPLALAVSGGEDYELLAAIPPAQLGAAGVALGEAAETTLTQIGEVVAGSGVEIRLPGGGRLGPRGYDQLG